MHTIIDWMTGNGQWHTLPQCLGGDSYMVALVVGLDTAVALLYFWIAFYWRRCQKAAATSQSIAAMGQLRQIFIWCSLSGYGFTLMKLIWPAWWIWIGITVVLIYHCVAFIMCMRRGFVFVYKDIQTLHQIRERLKFVETRQNELDAIRNQLCEIRNLAKANQR